MKTMTCRQLGGACDLEFHANSFEEMAELSKQHGMEMFQQGDKEHLQAMDKMKEMIGDPTAMERWMQVRRDLFDSLADDE